MHSNDMCTYAPVRDIEEVEANDIVFGELWQGCSKRFFAHLVVAREWGGGAGGTGPTTPMPAIPGRESGWRRLGSMYGRMAACAR